MSDMWVMFVFIWVHPEIEGRQNECECTVHFPDTYPLTPPFMTQKTGQWSLMFDVRTLHCTTLWELLTKIRSIVVLEVLLSGHVLEIYLRYTTGISPTYTSGISPAHARKIVIPQNKGNRLKIELIFNKVNKKTIAQEIWISSTRN